MIYRFGDIEYKFTFTDLPHREEYKCRSFEIKDKNGKGYHFTVRYKLDNENFPIDFIDNGGGFPKEEQLEVLIQSLKL